MTKEKKIENAALYWNTCEKDGFPEGQKEVFQEWLDKDIKHKDTYTRLYNYKQNIISEDEIIENGTGKVFYFFCFLTLILISFLIISIKL